MKTLFPSAREWRYRAGRADRGGGSSDRFWERSTTATAAASVLAGSCGSVMGFHFCCGLGRLRTISLQTISS